MLIYALWSITLGLQALLITAAVYRGLFRKYLGFYTYLTATILVSAARFYVRSAHREAYLGFYWWTELGLVAMGFAVTFGIFNSVLRYYPGVRTMANFFATGAFMFVAAQAGIQAATGDLREVIGGVMRFQRHMRFLEITLLALLTMLILYYCIPLGRNVRGLLLGYSLYLISSAVMITARGFATPSSQNLIETVRQFSGIVTALIWVTMLWRFDPSPVPVNNELEQDYAFAAARTRTAIAHARSRLFGLFGA